MTSGAQAPTPRCPAEGPGGWRGLTTLRETGESLDTPGSRRWLQGNKARVRHVAHD